MKNENTLTIDEKIAGSTPNIVWENGRVLSSNCLVHESKEEKEGYHAFLVMVSIILILMLFLVGYCATIICSS